MKKYLFVCKHNFTRSKFGAEFFRGYLLAKNKEVKVISRGLGFSSYFFGRKLRRKDLKDTDFIFVMENYMKDKIFEKFNFDKKKIIVLNIKDEYGFGKIKNIEDLDKKFKKINWKKYL